MKYYERPPDVKQFAIDNDSQISREEIEYHWEGKTKDVTFYMKDKTEVKFSWSFDGVPPEGLDIIEPPSLTK